jgi:hypothetical protein
MFIHRRLLATNVVRLYLHPAFFEKLVEPNERESTMKFGYTIFYVKSVVETVEFYERAFGLQRKFIHESEQYA